MNSARSKFTLRNALFVAGLLTLPLFAGCPLGSSSGSFNVLNNQAQSPVPAKKVIVFVWDGLRPDSINATDTPNLYALQQAGVNFTDNHSTYPTFTMMNSASFATGSFPGKTGFYGNTLWQPGPTGTNSALQTVDFNQPVFTEDYGVLQDLDQFYNNQLLMVGTLFQAAQKAGLKTAAVGKSGAAFLQDYKKGGLILDEKMAWPQSLVQELQAAGTPLPKLTPNAYPAGTVTLASNNGDPTASPATVKMTDGVTADPSVATVSPPAAANQYMMNAYLNTILPNHNPDLTLIWFRNPDSTQHPYGVGVPAYKAALKSQDDLLGQLQAKLKALGMDKTTDLIVVSDHGHSNVSGDPAVFPLHAISSGAVAGTDATNGYSVSGDVRTSDLLKRAGFSYVYDGNGCIYDPVLSGIKGDGTTVYPTLTDDANGTVCGVANKKYITGSFVVPATLPAGTSGNMPVVIAANGGSDYLYVPSHDAVTVQNLVKFLQQRKVYGAVFVDQSRYGNIPGTLPLNVVHLENTAGRNPDIIVSFNFDENAVVQGFKGIEYESAQNNRGMHGSFSPIDVHNTLLASGPDFRTGFADTLPSGNVDVAPTVAQILGLNLSSADGRPLFEALANGAALTDYTVTPNSVASATVSGLTILNPTDLNGTDVDTTKTSYGFQLKTKSLVYKGNSYTYFDMAKAVRQ